MEILSQYNPIVFIKKWTLERAVDGINQQIHPSLDSTSNGERLLSKKAFYSPLVTESVHFPDQLSSNSINICAQKSSVWHFTKKKKAKLQHQIIGNYTFYTPKNPDKWRITSFSLCATDDAGQSMLRLQNKSSPPPPSLAAKEERSKEWVTFENGTI